MDIPAGVKKTQDNVDYYYAKINNDANYYAVTLNCTVNGTNYTKFKAGDAIVVYLYANSGTQAYKVGKTAQTAVSESNAKSSVYPVEHTLTASEIEDDGTLRIYRNSSNTYFAGISVSGTRTPSSLLENDMSITSDNPAVVAIEGTSTITYSSSSDGAVTFKSNDTSIATVDNTGKITGVAGGTTTITVSQAETSTYEAGERTVNVVVPYNVDASATTFKFSNEYYGFTYDGKWYFKNGAVIETDQSYQYANLPCDGKSNNNGMKITAGKTYTVSISGKTAADFKYIAAIARNNYDSSKDAAYWGTFFGIDKSTDELPFSGDEPEEFETMDSNGMAAMTFTLTGNQSQLYFELSTVEHNYVSFKAGDGTGDDYDEVAEVGANITLPTLSEAEFTAPSDKAFLGWLCSADNVTYDAGDTYAMPSTKGVTFTAQYGEPTGSLIKATWTSSTSAKISGCIGGTADVSTSSNQKIDNGKYFGIKLADGWDFLEGDIVNIHVSTVASGGKLMVFNDKTADDDHLVYSESGIGSVGDNKFTMTAAQATLANTNHTLYVYRDGTYCSWNPFIDYIEVTRPASGKTASDLAIVSGKETVALEADGTKTSYTLAKDVDFTTSSTGDITYESNNTAVATVDETTGVITAVAAGTATITISQAEDDTYAAGSKTITVNVTSASAAATLEWKASTNTSDTEFKLASKTSSVSAITVADVTLNNGMAFSAVPKNSNGAKLTTVADEENAGYISTTFTVADGYTFTPSELKTKVVSVTEVKNYKIEVSDGTNTWSPATQQTAGTEAAGYTLTFDDNTKSFTGTVTIKMWVWGGTSGTRFTSMTIDGTAAQTTSVTTNAGKWCSFTPSYNCEVAEGAQAYIVTGTEEAHQQETIKVRTVSVMKAGEGYFIKGAASTAYNITASSETPDDVTDSKLVGCLTAYTIPANDGSSKYAYVLGTQSGKTGLYYVGENEVTVPAGKAYLQSDDTSKPEFISLDFDAAPTEISSVTTDNGQTTVKAGKYVKNGRIVIVKDGKEYNLAGQQY